MAAYEERKDEFRISVGESRVLFRLPPELFVRLSDPKATCVRLRPSNLGTRIGGL